MNFSGTEILSWLVNVEKQDICKNIPQFERVLYLEFHYPNVGTPNFITLNNMPTTEKRFLKTHLPPSFLDSSLWDAKPKVKFFL